LTLRRGPELPYTVITGVTPWRRKWIAACAKMQGATFAPEEPRIYDTFAEILNERPSYVSIVVNAPIGFRDSLDEGPRACDVEARKLLGIRGRFLHNAPTRVALFGDEPGREQGLDIISMMLLPNYREVALEMSPFRQRVLHEGHPELSFYQLNGNKPLTRSKKTVDGRDERRAILEQKVPGIDRIIDAPLGDIPQKHLYDAAAMLWTARRVAGHAATRMPADAEWDSTGLRMEMVY
jgi:predicted RNase H-like nuclease